MLFFYLNIEPSFRSFRKNPLVSKYNNSCANRIFKNLNSISSDFPNNDLLITTRRIKTELLTNFKITSVTKNSGNIQDLQDLPTRNSKEIELYKDIREPELNSCAVINESTLVRSFLKPVKNLYFYYIENWIFANKNYLLKRLNLKFEKLDTYFLSFYSKDSLKFSLRSSYSIFYFKKTRMLTFMIFCSFRKFVQNIEDNVIGSFAKDFLLDSTVGNSKNFITHFAGSCFNLGMNSLKNYETLKSSPEMQVQKEIVSSLRVENKLNPRFPINSFNPNQLHFFVALFEHILKLNAGLSHKTGTLFQLFGLNQQELWQNSCYFFFYLYDLKHRQKNLNFLEHGLIQKLNNNYNPLYGDLTKKENFYMFKENFYFFVYFLQQPFLYGTSFYNRSLVNSTENTLNIAKKSLFNKNLSGRYFKKQESLLYSKALEPYKDKPVIFLNFIKESLSFSLKVFEKTSDNLIFRSSQVLSVTILNSILKQRALKVARGEAIFPYALSLNLTFFRNNIYHLCHKMTKYFPLKFPSFTRNFFYTLNQTSKLSTTLSLNLKKQRSSLELFIIKAFFLKIESFDKLETAVYTKYNNNLFLLVSSNKENLYNEILTKFKVWVSSNFIELKDLREYFSKNAAHNENAVLLDLTTGNINKRTNSASLSQNTLSTLSFFLDFKNFLKKYSSISQTDLIKKLTPVLYAYVYIYSRKPDSFLLNSCLTTDALIQPLLLKINKQENGVFLKTIEKQILKLLWKWACRRHNNKSKKWIQAKYFFSLGNTSSKLWVFGLYKESSLKKHSPETRLIYLPYFSQILYHLKRTT